MAKRSTTAVAEAPAEVSTDAPQETVVTDTITEPEAGTPMTAEEIAANTPSEPSDPNATPAEDKEVIDLSGLWSALDAILATEPTDPEAVDFKDVIAAYNALSRAGKGEATREMDKRSKDLLEGGKFDSARVVLVANKTTKANKPKGESKPRTPADVTSPVVTRLASFQLAYGALAGNLPEGIAEDWQAQVTAAFEVGQAEVETLRAWQNADEATRGEEPKVSEAAVNAVKIAFKASRKPYGPRHDVGLHIAQVFAEAGSGTFMTDAEIASAKSDEYGDDECSTSAVTARLNAVEKQSKPLSEGLSVETREDKLGVVKA